MTADGNRGAAPRPLDERLGIFQGRLVPSASGTLQSSPGSRWPEEFAAAGVLGLAYIELLAERVLDPSNPMWSSEGRAAIRAASAAAGLGLVSMCIEEPLEVAVRETEVAVRLAERLSLVLIDVPLGVVVLPMYEASDLTVVPWEPAAAAVGFLASSLRRHGARTALELSLPAADSLRFLATIESPHVGLCYDLGNATAAGFDPNVEIPLLGRHIWHVHAKDKDDRGVNVRFGTGSVDFGAAFDALGACRYDGAVTIEATRGDDPIATAAEHRSFLLALDRPYEPG